jgi:hypothetical protein
MLHPLALYLGVLGIGSAVFSELLSRRVRLLGAAAGSRVLLFVFVFALGRGLIEGLRLKPELMLTGGSWARPESFALAVVAGALLQLRVLRERRVAAGPSPSSRKLGASAPGAAATRARPCVSSST